MMTSGKKVLVTGGAGFIGSHACKHLARDGFDVLVYDNLSNGHRHNVKWGPLVIADILDEERLGRTLRDFRPDAVMHFAASAYVGESVVDPLKYYQNNVQGTLSLLRQMKSNNISNIVFSSTCATYGVPDRLPILESMPQEPVNPYGWSKLMVEQILADFHNAYGFRVAVLRYFNACGADLDGQLAEEHDPETHLIPRCLQAAAGIIPAIEVFGDDYPTDDGTCIRDYVHVDDLACGHVSALRYILNRETFLALNLGTGTGYSVRQIITAIEKLLNVRVPYIVRSRREGDPPILVADASLSKKLIDFSPANSSLDCILQTAWRRYEKFART